MCVDPCPQVRQSRHAETSCQQFPENGKLICNEILNRIAIMCHLFESIRSCQYVEPSRSTGTKSNVTKKGTRDWNQCRVISSIHGTAVKKACTA